MFFSRAARQASLDGPRGPTGSAANCSRRRQESRLIGGADSQGAEGRPSLSRPASPPETTDQQEQEQLSGRQTNLLDSGFAKEGACGGGQSIEAPPPPPVPPLQRAAVCVSASAPPQCSAGAVPAGQQPQTESTLGKTNNYLSRFNQLPGAAAAAGGADCAPGQHRQISVIKSEKYELHYEHLRPTTTTTTTTTTSKIPPNTPNSANAANHNKSNSPAEQPMRAPKPSSPPGEWSPDGQQVSSSTASGAGGGQPKSPPAGQPARPSAAAATMAAPMGANNDIPARFKSARDLSYADDGIR